MRKKSLRGLTRVRFLADANIPKLSVQLLSEKGIDIISIRDINPGMKNIEVARLSAQLNRVLITFDKRFLWTIVTYKVKIPGLIILRIGMEKKAHELAEFLYELITHLKPSNIEGYAIIVSGKLRKTKL